MGSSSAKDQSWSQRYPGKSNFIILTSISTDFFNKWKSQRCMHRDKEYTDLKEQFAQRLLNKDYIDFILNYKEKSNHMK